MDKQNATCIEDAVAVTADQFVENPELEKRLLRKIDMRLLPPLFVMLAVYPELIGNAREAGMAKDLNLTSSNYSLAVSIFFIGYLLLEVPSNMILSRTRPSLFLPGLMIVWGGMVIAYVGVDTKDHLIALRFCLGLVEAGFFPGVLLLLSSWYKKSELARRFSIFYCSSLLSGAVGGLIVEGCMTIGFAVIAIFILPDFPATTRWLTPEEREYAIRRLAKDNNYTLLEAPGHWQSFMQAVKDWRTWVFVLAQSLCTCAGTITYFIPTLMVALGYEGQQTQYMTIPIYMTALVIVLISCFSSDLQNERPKHIMAMAALATLSLIIVAAVENSRVRYAFLCFGGAGIWACSPLTLSYLSNTISQPAEKRAVAIGIVNALANLSSVYGSYIWPSNSAPKYIAGFSVSICLMFGAIVTAFLLKVLLNKFPYPYESERPAETDHKLQA
ncbi:Major facilitator superfamily domain, general substrate transporter [Cordyceps fumosorosea ARSEF 2679]|uniref:Major facilitator superfamily domain, general substrate transporter n=1 Tax=Cordyceps fumosorosea (strain ARSEF 2679) TaxID=1081104 RepID=A0A162LEZ0_CORFA|nr:Major facilitator superfamily domain, general substrate transporter [Cordyceps fumosorosea ARSEF 2679]OAA69694.1 Major facilitator superfamily domain, general substrate transporter [Cordyceps fumosorosea ARSEF 2679]